MFPRRLLSVMERGEADEAEIVSVASEDSPRAVALGCKRGKARTAR
jgi:hypothetical protein